MNTFKQIIAYFLALIVFWSSSLPIAFANQRFDPSSAARTRFGNVSFDPSPFADVINQGQTLLLVSTNPKYRDSVHVTVGPQMGGSAQSVISQIWPSVFENKPLKEKIIDDSDLMISGGGKIHRHIANYQDGSTSYILVAEVNSKLTPFVLATHSSVETSIGGLIMMQIVMTIRGEAESGGTNSTGPLSEPVGSPSDLGEDPYDSVDWDGPDQWGFGIYDIHPVNVKRELARIALLTPEFIGTVTPRQMTFDQAIANLRTLADSPWTKRQYAEFKDLGSKDPFTLQGSAFAGVLAGEPVMALLQLFAAYEIHPEDANNWLNLAAMCSHVRMANESTAILKEMDKRGKKPDPPIVSSEAVIEYLTGYNQLLFGQTLTAKGHLHKAMDLDPFLKEAAIALAYAQKMTGDEEAAEATYIQGVWRRRPTQRLYCGGTDSADGQDIRPPIPDMLDVSRGTPGVLPNFDHPNNWSEALGLKQRYERTITQLAGEGKDFAIHVQDVGKRISGTHPHDATEKWYQYLDLLGTTLRVQEPQVKKALAIKDKAQKELEEAVKRIGKRTAPKLVPIMMQPGDHHNELAAIATDNVASLRPFAQAFDTAVRRLHRLEHRFETGLAAQMGNNDWHELELTRIKVEAISAYVGMTGVLMGSYMLVASIVPPPATAPVRVGMVPEDVDMCANGIRNLGFKFSFDVPFVPIKAGIKATCEKVSVEAGVYPWKLEEKGILELSAGAFVQADFKGHGDVTIFSGVNGKGGIGPTTAGASVKAGVYVTTNLHTGEVKDLGLKATAEATSKLGENLSVNFKGGEGKISMIPSIPQSPRGTDLGDHRVMPR